MRRAELALREPDSEWEVLHRNLFLHSKEENTQIQAPQCHRQLCEMSESTSDFSSGLPGGQREALDTV